MVEPLRSYLLSAVDYNPSLGTMVFKDAPPTPAFEGSKFPAERMRKCFVSRFVGRPAFNYLTSEGYLKGSFLRERYAAHRIAWLIVYGTWPSGEIDHINGCRTDNRIENLRDVTRTENRMNACMMSNNTSGHCGVSWSPSAGKWAAYINLNKKRMWLGFYDRKEDAANARKQAESALGFHPNHGRITHATRSKRR